MECGQKCEHARQRTAGRVVDVGAIAGSGHALKFGDKVAGAAVDGLTRERTGQSSIRRVDQVDGRIARWQRLVYACHVRREELPESSVQEPPVADGVFRRRGFHLGRKSRRIARAATQRALFSQTLYISDDLPARRLGQRAPGRHPLLQVSVFQQREKLAVGCPLHFLGAQAGPFPPAQRVLTVALGAVVLEQSRSTGNRIRLLRVGIRPGPVGVGDVFQPAGVRRDGYQSGEHQPYTHEWPAHFARP